MNKRLFLMMGIPGSGKSTFVRKRRDIFDNPIVVSRDKIRFSLLEEGDEYFSKEDEVLEEFTKQIVESLSRPMGDTIVDATHLNGGSRRKILNLITRAGGSYDEVRVIWLRTPLDVALKRNAKRTGRAFVPEDAIKNMYNSLTKPAIEEGIDWLYTVTSKGIKIEKL